MASALPNEGPRTDELVRLMSEYVRGGEVECPRGHSGSSFVQLLSEMVTASCSITLAGCCASTPRMVPLVRLVALSLLACLILLTKDYVNILMK